MVALLALGSDKCLQRPCVRVTHLQVSAGTAYQHGTREPERHSGPMQWDRVIPLKQLQGHTTLRKWIKDCCHHGRARERNKGQLRFYKHRAASAGFHDASQSEWAGGFEKKMGHKTAPTNQNKSARSTKRNGPIIVNKSAEAYDLFLYLVRFSYNNI